MTLALIILILPVVSFMLLLVFQKTAKNFISYFSLFTSAILVLFSIINLFYSGLTEVFSLSMIEATTIFPGLRFMLQTGNTASFVFVIISVINLSISLYNFYSAEDNSSRYDVCRFLSLFSLLGIALSVDFFTLILFCFAGGFSSYYVSWQMETFTRYKLLIINLFADTALFSTGIIIYYCTGSFEISAAIKAITTGSISVTMQYAVGILLFVVLAGKSLVFPLVYRYSVNENNSPGSRTIFLTFSIPTAGILLAIKFVPLIPASVSIALVVLCIVIFLYSIILAINGFNKLVDNISISQNCFIIILLLSGYFTSALILFAAFLFARPLILFTFKVLNDSENRYISWLALASVMIFSGFPLTLQFLSNSFIINSSLNNFVSPLTQVLILLLTSILSFASSFSIFRYYFALPDHAKYSMPKIKEIPSIAGIILLAAGSLFVFYSFDPLNPINMRLLNYFDPGLLTKSDFVSQYLYSILALVFPVLGVFFAYLVVIKKVINIGTNNRIYLLENYFDKLFLLAFNKQRQIERDENKGLSISNIIYRVLKLKEAGTYISFSLILIVIFYFIFRNM